MSLALNNLVGFGCDSSSGCACTPNYDSGNRTASITATASVGLLGGGTADNLVDGATGLDNNDSIYLNVVSLDGSQFIRFDFGSGASVKIVEATWTQNNTTSLGTWKWQASNDASSWTDIGSTFTLGGSTSQTQTSLSSNSSGYRYYRLLSVSGSTSSSPYITEITFKRCNC